MDMTQPDGEMGHPSVPAMEQDSPPPIACEVDASVSRAHNDQEPAAGPAPDQDTLSGDHIDRAILELLSSVGERGMTDDELDTAVRQLRNYALTAAMWGLWAAKHLEVAWRPTGGEIEFRLRREINASKQANSGRDFAS